MEKRASTFLFRRPQVQLIRKCACLSGQPPTPPLSDKHVKMIQICRAEDGEVFQVCPFYVSLATLLTGGADECHALGHRKVPRGHVMRIARRLNALQNWKPRAIPMQGGWDRRECGTGVSFRRAEVKNGQCAGSRGGTGPGASSNSAMFLVFGIPISIYV